MVHLSEATTSHRWQLNLCILDGYLQLEVAASKGYEPIHYANPASIDSVLKQQSFKQLHDKLCTSSLHGDRMNSFLPFIAPDIQIHNNFDGCIEKFSLLTLSAIFFSLSSRVQSENPDELLGVHRNVFFSLCSRWPNVTVLIDTVCDKWEPEAPCLFRLALEKSGRFIDVFWTSVFQ